MTYEELWAAQVRARATVKCDIYSALQAMLKCRTSLGKISGMEKIPNRGGVWPYPKNGINHDSGTLYVHIHNREEEGIRITFWTKR